MTSTPSSLPTRSWVGDYELIVQIGEGGMGVVHLARRPGEDRVALKVLRPHVVGDEEGRARFAREVGSLQRIRSRWVAEVVDADPWAEVPYVATRYVPGLSLHDHVLEEGAVTGRDLTWFAGCLAEGLATVHEAGVLHRDVKPSNVLMEGRTPILIDFGLARLADDPRLTRTGWLLGTPGYLAPEILYGDEPTAAGDVHSWAATVGYAAVGAPPFGRGPAMAIMDRVRRGQHDLGDLADPLRSVLTAALDPEPDQRPTLPELLDWLRPQSTRPHDPPVAPPVGHPEQPEDHDGPLEQEEQHETAYADETSPYLLRERPPDPMTCGLDDTRVLTVPAAAPAVGDGWDEGGSYWGRNQADDQLDYPPDYGDGFRDDFRDDYREGDRAEPPYAVWEPWQPPRASVAERTRAGVLSLLVGGVATAAFAALPWLALLLVGLAVWWLRSGSLARSALADRRARRGRPAWWDAPGLVLAAPVHLVRGVPSTVLLALVAGALAASAGLVALVVLGSSPGALGVAGAGLVVALWWGPGGSRVRGPVGSLTRPLARRFDSWVAAVALLLLAAGVFAYAAADGPDWTPGDRPSLVDPIGAVEP